MLALSSVQADTRLGDAALASVKGYYLSDTAAEEVLAQLRAGEVPEGVITKEKDGHILATYVEPISDTQALQVSVAFNGKLGDDYEIVQWQARSTAEVDLEQHIEVYDGE